MLALARTFGARTPVYGQSHLAPNGAHAPVLETLRVSRTPFLRNVILQTVANRTFGARTPVLRTVVPRRPSPAPPASGRSPSRPRRRRTGRVRPPPAQTSGGRAPPAGALAAPAPDFHPFSARCSGRRQPTGVLLGLIQISATRLPYRQITSDILAFAHTHTSIHPGTGAGGCVSLLLYFSTKREKLLSICTSTLRSGAFPGRLIFAVGAGILR